MGHCRPLFRLFSSFQTDNTILQQINVKNVPIVKGPGIQTHDLRKHEPPSTTTRPEFPPLYFLFHLKFKDQSSRADVINRFWFSLTD